MTPFEQVHLFRRLALPTIFDKDGHCGSRPLAIACATWSEKWLTKYLRDSVTTSQPSYAHGNLSHAHGSSSSTTDAEVPSAASFTPLSVEGTRAKSAVEPGKMASTAVAKKRVVFGLVPSGPLATFIRALKHGRISRKIRKKFRLQNSRFVVDRGFPMLFMNDVLRTLRTTLRVESFYSSDK